MPAKKYVVQLSEAEREALHRLTRQGQVSARKMKRAQILLKADAGWKDAAIITALNVSDSTVERLRKQYVTGGLEKALHEAPRPGRVPRLSGKQAAFLVALTCSEAPDGRERWTMQLLADKLLALGVIDEPVSEDTVRRALKKTTSSPG